MKVTHWTGGDTAHRARIAARMMVHGLMNIVQAAAMEPEEPLNSKTMSAIFDGVLEGLLTELVLISDWEKLGAQGLTPESLVDEFFAANKNTVINKMLKQHETVSNEQKSEQAVVLLRNIGTICLGAYYNQLKDLGLGALLNDPKMVGIAQVTMPTKEVKQFIELFTMELFGENGYKAGTDLMDQLRKRSEEHLKQTRDALNNAEGEAAHG